MISEEMLKKAAAEAEQAIRDSLPAPAACKHEFSPSFQRKMRRAFRKAKHPIIYKFPKYVASFVLVAILTSSIWLTVDFSNLKKSVDSNSWSYIGSATKDSATENGELKITKMYDADGNETSLYSQVYAKATSSGTSTLVTSGSWYDVPIPSSFQAASKSVSLYCKGHIPWIDCKISGYWNVH